MDHLFVVGLLEDFDAETLDVRVRANPRPKDLRALSRLARAGKLDFDPATRSARIVRAELAHLADFDGPEVPRELDLDAAARLCH